MNHQLWPSVKGQILGKTNRKYFCTLGHVKRPLSQFLRIVSIVYLPYISYFFQMGINKSDILHLVIGSFRQFFP